MPLIVIDTYRPTDAELRHAIEVRCAACFGAMNIANAIAGRETLIWRLIRNYTLLQLLEEADTRGLDMQHWRTAVEQEPLQASRYYQHARHKMLDNPREPRSRNMQIIYHASNETMGDTPPVACNDYRSWAHRALCAEFPNAVVTVDDANVLDQCWTDDEARRDKIQEFCARLWDICPWDWIST